jgi:flagellar assembly protein FliH
MASLEPQCVKRRNGLVDEDADREHGGDAMNRSRDEGFRHGLAVGHAQGQAAGEAKALQYNQQFSQILAGIGQAVTALDETVADELVKLALAVARSVVRTHLDTHPDAVLPVVREALNSIAAIAHHPRLTMHPDDADIVKRDMAAELAELNCRIVPDKGMARGGVHIDDASFELDATLATRWNRTLVTLGMNDDRIA